ncbi:hypothetical protein M427DRAFT_146048 [Gonapodya prolifera JEL478]|uniref:Uncharacterized protein n=1 Tax=Gonapodya prolifera (strain JEL478) TaxID=1344416 RepID=A0A139ADJ0_GONPJ|nr:hypothetical protein M427DRAFT_146048 [Gonapodya prolifera JEL478]|eukprot:KXS14483.1 hypothetical protein M427DRAFT_146048 [Gonapodya prolifera JEL478]
MIERLERERGRLVDELNGKVVEEELSWQGAKDGTFKAVHTFEPIHRPPLYALECDGGGGPCDKKILTGFAIFHDNQKTERVLLGTDSVGLARELGIWHSSDAAATCIKLVQLDTATRSVLIKDRVARGEWRELPDELSEFREDFAVVEVKLRNVSERSGELQGQRLIDLAQVKITQRSNTKLRKNARNEEQRLKKKRRPRVRDAALKRILAENDKEVRCCSNEMEWEGPLVQCDACARWFHPPLPGTNVSLGGKSPHECDDTWDERGARGDCPSFQGMRWKIEDAATRALTQEEFRKYIWTTELITERVKAQIKRDARRKRKLTSEEEDGNGGSQPDGDPRGKRRNCFSGGQW